jgi:hypothetical protein
MVVYGVVAALGSETRNIRLDALGGLDVDLQPLRSEL